MVTWARVEKEIAQSSAVMSAVWKIDLTLTGFKTLLGLTSPFTFSPV
jgi:hypothetical protein